MVNASITWHGHSNFQVQAQTCNLVIDPFFTGNPLCATCFEDITPPDMVLVTHMHEDHFGDTVSICKKYGSMLLGMFGALDPLIAQGVPEAQVIYGRGFNIGGTVTVKETAVTMVDATHSANAGSPAGYIIRLSDGFTIYHAGDTGITVNMGLWGDLYSIDLALLPIGGVYTMDAHQAALAAKMLRAKAVIPMHYGTFPVLAASADAFAKEIAEVVPHCRYIAMEPGKPLLLSSIRA